MSLTSLQNTINNTIKKTMDEFFKKLPFLDNILKGIGQIMLQENRWTGLLFLIGIFMGSWQCGVAVLLSTAAGTFTAMKLKYDKSQINAGLYGFSAALGRSSIGFSIRYYILNLDPYHIRRSIGSCYSAFLYPKENSGVHFSFHCHYLGIGICPASFYPYSAVCYVECRGNPYKI
jgi:hypothetical protein